MFNKKKKKQQMNEQPVYIETAPSNVVEESAKPSSGKKLSASWKLMNNNGPVPIAPPADFIQLTPIVQPVPLVPYSTQLQPILTFDEDEEI